MNRRQADPTKRRRQQNDTDEIGPKAWSDPTGQALNVCWSRSRERQHHGLNHGRRTPVLRHQYKTGWKLRFFHREVRFIKMHRLFHWLTRLRRLLRRAFSEYD